MVVVNNPWIRLYLLKKRCNGGVGRPRWAQISHGFLLQRFLAPFFPWKAVMNLHHDVLPCQAKCRIGNDAMGEGLIELEVIGISGECILTLNVADSMLGRELWKMILDKVPSKPGLQLVVSHTSRLVLHESLQQQGLGGQRAQVWATYMPVNLHAAWPFAKGNSVEDAEFSLTGIATLTGVNDQTPALLHNLPQSLRTLTFAGGFNEGLGHVRLPAGLQSLTFGFHFNKNMDDVTWPEGLQNLTLGARFNQSLDNVTWPAGLQNLDFGRDFNQNLDNVTWPAGLQSLTFGLHFNQSLDNVTWPAGLQRFTFGQNFNQGLDNVTWPAGLQSLTFGGAFNQNLDHVTWPAGLQSLAFANRLQSLQDLDVLPGALGHLAIGELSLKRWTATATVSPSDFKEKSLRKEGSQKVWAFV